MSETRYTPGPWRAVDSDHIEDARGQWLAQLWDKREEAFLNAEANAHLIAAAPDLYRALEETKAALSALAMSVVMGSSITREQEARVNAAVDNAAAALLKARGDQ